MGRHIVQSNNYWSGTSYSNPDNAWNVNMNNGNTNNNNKSNNNNYVWPVRGDNDALPLFSFKNIFRQYLACRRNKRSAINPLAFEVNAEENLLDLKQALDNRTYRPCRSVCFMATRPKLREIFAADFRDRIVHHVLVNRLEKIWEPIFIYDSYACRRLKGIHAGIKRLQSFLVKATCNGTRRAWYLQLDIANFFMTIDKDILYGLISKKVQDEQMLWLARTVIYHDCTKDFILKGDRDYLKKIAPQKSLFFAGPSRGLPIGNLTSQFFANMYLNELDQFVKHHLRCRYYLRYCDDFVLVSENRDSLLTWKDEIEKFLARRLSLNLNKKRQTLQPVSNGVNFLGYIVRRNYILVRKRVVNNLRSKLDLFEKRLIQQERHPYIKVVYDYPALEQLQATLASYLGHFKWADSHRLLDSIFKRYVFLKHFFSFRKGCMDVLYKVPVKIPTLRLQQRYFRTKFPEDVLLLQVGCYYEFFGDEGKDIRLLGLKKMQRASGSNVRYGFPVRLEKRFVEKLMCAGRTVSVIKESDQYLINIKQRRPRYRLAMAGNE